MCLIGRMKPSAAAICVAAIILSGGIGRAVAGAADCQAALDNENMQRDEVETAQRGYQSCMQDAEDDCSTEFDQLKSAQEDLEAAVADRQGECE